MCPVLLHVTFNIQTDGGRVMHIRKESMKFDNILFALLPDSRTSEVGFLVRQSWGHFVRIMVRLPSNNNSNSWDSLDLVV